MTYQSFRPRISPQTTPQAAVLGLLQEKFGDKAGTFMLEIATRYYYTDVLPSTRDLSPEQKQELERAVHDLLTRAAYISQLHGLEVPGLTVSWLPSGSGLTLSTSQPQPVSTPTNPLNTSIPLTAPISSKTNDLNGAVDPNPEETDEPEDSTLFISESDRALQAMGWDLTHMETSRNY